MNYKIANGQEEILERLHDLMKIKKLYLETDCSLTSLAKTLGVPKRKISELIRDNFGKSFPIFLNDFRLKEVLERFKKRDFQKHTIIAIALEAGFPSKSTFYRYFQQKLKTSPIEYLRNHHL